MKFLKNRIELLINKKFIQLQNQNNLKLEEILLQNGRIWSAMLPKDEPINIQDAEFKVFSQWGDDGIIQYLINYLKIENKTFIEFGVEDYSESNTRFLMFNNNWRGLVMDGSKSHIEKIRNSHYFWKYDLQAKTSFITAENINQVIKETDFSGEIGLMHIDIDGNDYWVWKALKIVQPIIMIVEYNSIFGNERALTIPYKKDFNWTEAHYSNLYFGASILALVDLAKEKEYAFIGCNSAGNNAYFVKKEFLKELNSLTVEEGFVEAKFRQSRDENGKLNYLNRTDQLNTLKGMTIYNTRKEEIETI